MKKWQAKASIKGGGYVETVVYANNMSEARKIAARMLNCSESEVYSVWEIK
jgi:hypothetical protein